MGSDEQAQGLLLCDLAAHGRPLDEGEDQPYHSTFTTACAVRLEVISTWSTSGQSDSHDPCVAQGSTACAVQL